MSTYFEKGAADACAQLGLTKEAINWGGVATKAKGLGSKALEFMVGSPKKFMGEIRSGKALAPGSMVRESFRAPGLLNKAMFYGFPAVEAGNILTSSSENKGQELGGLIGGSALGIAAFRPLGMVGSIAAGTLGDYVGRGIGGLGQKAVNAIKRDPQPQQQVSSYGRPIYARNPIGAVGYRQMQGMQQG